jgi:hypothetical protein
VRGGEVVLVGNRNSPTLVIGDKDYGNMALVVSGEINFFMSPKSLTRTKLQLNMKPGDNIITVMHYLTDMKVGVQIVITSSTAKGTTSEKFIVTKVDGLQLTLDAPAKYYHYGASSAFNYIDKGTLDQRAEVFLLDRNMKIRGQSNDNTKKIEETKWGCHIVFTSFVDTDKKVYDGILNLMDTEITNCGKQDETGQILYNAIGFNSIKINRGGSFTTSSFYNIYGQALVAEGINSKSFSDIVVFGAYSNGFKFTDCDTISIRELSVIKVISIVDNNQYLKEISAGIAFFMSDFSKLKEISVKDSLVVGAEYGFVIPAQICDDSSKISHSNNMAVATTYGFLIYSPLSNATCIEIFSLKAIKSQYGIAGYPRVNMIKINNVLLSDNKVSIAINKAGEFENSTTQIINSVIGGFAKYACAECIQYEGVDECSGLNGIMLAVNLTKILFHFIRINILLKLKTGKLNIFLLVQVQVVF